MAKRIPENVKAYRKLIRLRDGHGRMAFEIVNNANDPFDVSYDDMGYYISNVVERHPESFDVIEDTIIAICGYGFESLLRLAKEHREEYDCL